jgi:hypothetical protein
VWCAAVIFFFPNQVMHVDRGNHDLNLPTNTPLSLVGFFYFKSFSNIFFPNIPSYSFNFSTHFTNFPTNPNTPLLLQFYFLQTITTTMSQPSNQNSPSNSSPNQTSSQKITVPNPQPSDIITNAVPLTMVHPSFASSLNLPKNKITTTNPSPSPKPKSKKKSKTNTTKKPKPQKPKSRYSSNFNMQELYLDNQGSASTNVASDAATTAPNVAIETAKEISSKSLNFEKGEIAMETEEKKNVVPNTPGDDEVDKDQLNLKAAEDSLKSLAHSVSTDKVVPDASTSLAQDQPQDDMIDDVDANKDDVVADSNVQQEKDISDDDTERADKDDTVEDDLVVLKSVVPLRVVKLVWVAD